MPAGAHGDEHLVDEVFLTDDDLAEFAEHAVAGMAGVIDRVLGGGGSHGWDPGG